jgi:hypothetical protein
MSGVSAVTLKGRVKKGCTWASQRHNWSCVIAAHRLELPEIVDYFPGTLNVVLHVRWSPPGDELHRRASHERGMLLRREHAPEANILANGNYLHPSARVRSIKGIEVDGRLYFPGIPDTRWKNDENVWKTIAPVDRIEIISKTQLRKLLGISPDEECDVEVVIEFRDGAVAVDNRDFDGRGERS